MAIVQSICVSFLEELSNEEHDINSDTFKIALYTNAADLGPGTTEYTTTNEITGTGYTAGGATLSSGTIAKDGNTVLYDWDDPSWTSSSLTAAAAMIYNTSQSNKAVMILDFGGDHVTSNGTFLVSLPTPDASNGLVRFIPGV